MAQVPFASFLSLYNNSADSAKSSLPRRAKKRGRPAMTFRPHRAAVQPGTPGVQRSSCLDSVSFLFTI